MELNGMDQLRKHVPELRTPGGIALIALAFAGVITLVTLFFVWVDRVFIEWMPDGEIVIMAIGFLLLSLFFSRRTIYQQKYGELAYRNAFAHFCLPGLGIIFASVAHMGYMPGPEIPALWWKTVLIALGWVAVLIGAVLWIRSVATFGVDYLAMLYVYHPEESRMVDSSIYGVIRHPIYAAALRIGVGLALLNGNWYALVVALIWPIFLTGWIRLVEEKELLERFPDYAEYRKRVPAFWPRPRNLFRFFQFLFTGG
jgi:protein-S-isoprenylcysteine O-methyltransferase Ste14